MMKMLYIQRTVLALTVVSALTVLPAHAQIVANSSTTNWIPVLYPASNPTTPDPAADQQTGSQEGDIVGSATIPSLYTSFYNGGTPSLTDGQLAFRLRLAGEQNPPGFSGAAFIGLDGNNDGRLDIFMGVNNSGSTAQIGLWRAGNGLNNSPSTTTIQSPASFSYAETSVNYNWTPVNATIDPTSMNYDVDNGGSTDHFLSFVVPFADLVSLFGTVGINGINENSVFSYVAATATQANSLNQDLNGVNGGVNSGTTWQQLGALTQPMTATGSVVPEPSTWTFIALGSVAFILTHRLRRGR